MSDVLAVAEHRRGELRDVSYELVTAGRELADATGGDLHLAVVSGDVEAFAERLNLEGVDVVHTVDYGEEFNHDVYLQAVEGLFEAIGPRVLLMPNSVDGLDYAPAAANALDLPLVSDAVGLDLDGSLVATREMYGSKVETTVEVDAEQVAVTVRPGEWPPTEDAGEADVVAADVEIDESAVRSRVTGYEEVAGGDVDITEADVLVSIGRGIEEEENLDLIFDLAEALDATVSASRPIVDNGWLPKNRQVGQSGKVVTPDVYIAIGISGAVQ
ncbi:MAG: electron transfer flavoprotein subunit alpha/FixB family protein, partial [Salinigranum sp.]